MEVIMAKFYGKIGYAETVETAPGVYEEQIVEREHSGDFVRNSGKLVTSENLNSNVDVSTEISIVSDPYAMQHYLTIRYVEIMGAKWKVSSVEIKYPRLILSIGGLYNVQ